MKPVSRSCRTPSTVPFRDWVAEAATMLVLVPEPSHKRPVRVEPSIHAQIDLLFRDLDALFERRENGERTEAIRVQISHTSAALLEKQKEAAEAIRKKADAVMAERFKTDAILSQARTLLEEAAERKASLLRRRTGD